METWERDYRQARFRDVNFYVDSDDSGPFGRRVAIHEFPERDEPVVQDLGRNKREFTLEGYLLGADYINETNRLIDACEMESPGELVHPTRGARVVKCTSMRIRNTSKKRRISYVSLSFIQADEFIPELEEITDSALSVVNSRTSALSKLSEYFVEVFDVVNLPYSYAVNAQNAFISFISQVESNRSIVSSASGFMRLVKTSVENVALYVFSSTDLIGSIISLLSFGTTEDDDYPATEDTARNQFTEIRKLFEFTPTRVVDSTDPTMTMSYSIQAAALISVTGLLPLITYDSLDEAIIFKTIILDKIDSLVASINNDSVYESLYDLRKSIMIDMEQRAFTLSRLSTTILSESLPALTMSYRLYGDLEQEDDLIKRNSILHPGFMPGGVELEVLLNA